MTAVGTIALLDANVLYPAPVRDLLLSFADARLFQPKWSSKIQEEWVRNLLKKRPDISEKNILKTVKAMNVAFPDAEVSKFTSIIEDLKLPDPDDRHVLAAAIKAGATFIVTANIKDFPSTYVFTHRIRVCHPDDFISGLIVANIETARMAFERMILRLRNPPLNYEDILAMLERCGLTASVKLLA